MSKRKVLIIADIPGWCYARRAAALAKYAPERWAAGWCDWRAFLDADSSRLADADLIFLLDYSLAEPARRAMQQRGLTCPLVVSWNRGAGQKLAALQNARHFADAIVFNNKQAFRWAYDRGFRSIAYVCNGVDLETFRVTRPLGDRPDRVLWTGSDAPHKGKGWWDILAPLDIQLRSVGIEPDFRPLRNARDARVMSESEMVEWYNSGKVILCASQSEGTPNTTLEGVACGCVPVSTRTGNIVDIGTEDADCVLVDRDVGAFMRGIQLALGAYESMAPRALRTIQRLSYGPPAWHAHRFYEVFDAVMERSLS